ncbi:MAG: cytochrome c oxidase accessory protein CcoG [Pseudomonadota bacterium]|jgi:cytochrome c oxidase accessory protein FixG
MNQPKPKVIPIRPVPSGAKHGAAQPVTGSAEVEQSLFEVRKKIYPRAVSGWYANWRWIMVWFTQILFYGTAWLNWNGRQALLFDLASRKFYIFGLVLWPQDFIYLSLLLIISAFSLFLVTALFGRVFCGYACPQTVYTHIFLWIEKLVEGGRGSRIELDKAPHSARKWGLKLTKHGLWLAFALWTGITFVGYFTPIRQLLPEVQNWQLGPWETFWILFYGFATYGNAGWMREQVCKYMCPYARFQSAMLDKDSLIITYDHERGEPRGSRSKKADPKELGLGSCVDCEICVQVCPTGIDIRNGLQYECIGCAACVDACNQVMEKMAYAPGLIRYDSENGLHTHHARWRHLLRTRTMIYAGILGAIVFASATALSLRLPLKVDVLRDRGLPRVTETGAVDNVYRLQVMNTEERAHQFEVVVSGIPGITLVSGGQFELGPASSRAIPVRVRVPVDHVLPGSNRIQFVVRERDNPDIAVTEKAVFLAPR